MLPSNLLKTCAFELGNSPLIRFPRRHIGDLIIYDIKKKFDKPIDFLNYLFQTNGDNWKRILFDKTKYFIEQDVFVICFETVQKETSEKLHTSLENEEDYLGCFEIDSSIELHWWLYGECIGPKFRILNSEVNRQECRKILQ